MASFVTRSTFDYRTNYASGLLDHIRIRRPYTVESFIQHFVPDMSEEEAKAAATFLRRCITLDPQARPSAEDLLQDPWLMDA